MNVTGESILRLALCSETVVDLGFEKLLPVYETKGLDQFSGPSRSDTLILTFVSLSGSQYSEGVSINTRQKSLAREQKQDPGAHNSGGKLLDGFTQENNFFGIGGVGMMLYLLLSGPPLWRPHLGCAPGSCLGDCGTQSHVVYFPHPCSSEAGNLAGGGESRDDWGTIKNSLY